MVPSLFFVTFSHFLLFRLTKERWWRELSSERGSRSAEGWASRDRDAASTTATERRVMTEREMERMVVKWAGRMVFCRLQKKKKESSPKEAIPYHEDHGD